MSVMDNPLPIRLLLIANTHLDLNDQTLHDNCHDADLVVSLGGVDIHQLAQILPERKPALCLLGPKDPQHIPRRLRSLHGSGFTFKNWRVAGLSGGKKLSNSKGFYLSEEEASTLLGNLPSADIFLSHAYPTVLTESGLNPVHGMPALDNYLQQKTPIYYFYAHPSDNILEENPEYLSVGINGTYLTPPLEYI